MEAEGEARVDVRLADVHLEDTQLKDAHLEDAQLEDTRLCEEGEDTHVRLTSRDF